MSVVYNSCNCPASAFSGEQPFPDLEIEAVVGPTQEVDLEYQTNYMGYVYNQDCGSYGIDYYPKYSFFEITETGTKFDDQGRTYMDLGTFRAGTLNDIGEYTVTILSYQDQDNPEHGFNIPYRGVMPAHEQ